MTTPQPNQFLVQPINASDLIVVFRGSDVSRPLYMTYKNLLAVLTAAISGGGTSGLLLQTNNVNNPVQDVLNLIQGSGISIVDNGDGSVTFSATGGGSVTADNGLTETSGNVQLGGLLIQDTTIDTSTFNFIVSRAQTGSALQVINNGLIGVPSAAEFTSKESHATLHLRNAASTNTIETIIKLERQTTGTAANGIGGAIDIWVETLFQTGITPAGIPAVRLVARWTVAALLTRSSRFELYTVHNAVQKLVQEMSSYGQQRLNAYGVGDFADTPTYLLGVDASGNVIEVTPSGSGAVWGGITGTLSDQTDLQNALDDKVDANAAITGATKTKITYDSKGLVINGADAGISDITGLSAALAALADLTNIYVKFDTGAALTYDITIDVDTQGTYSLASFSGGMSSATYKKNAVSASLPITLAIGDVLNIVPNAVGTIKLSGNI
jgi:hypothetical protein